jgi:hypothetical protein
MASALTRLQILERVKMRVQQRITALEGTRLEGYSVAIYELRVVMMTITKAMNYVRDLEQRRAAK